MANSDELKKFRSMVNGESSSEYSGNNDELYRFRKMAERGEDAAYQTVHMQEARSDTAYAVNRYLQNSYDYNKAYSQWISSRPSGKYVDGADAVEKKNQERQKSLKNDMHNAMVRLYSDNSGMYDSDVENASNMVMKENSVNNQTGEYISAYTKYWSGVDKDTYEAANYDPSEDQKNVDYWKEAYRRAATSFSGMDKQTGVSKEYALSRWDEAEKKIQDYTRKKERIEKETAEAAYDTVRKENIRNYDPTKDQENVDFLKAVYDRANASVDLVDPITGQNAADAEKLWKQAQKKVAQSIFEQQQLADSERWGSVSKNADFSEYSKKQQNSELYDYINDEDFRKYYDDTHTGSILGNTNEYAQYANLNPEEINIFNYYYAKDGEEKAKAYLASLGNTLNSRIGNRQYEDIKGNRALELAFGVEAGLDQFRTGVQGVVDAVSGNDTARPISHTAYASSEIREDLADLGSDVLGNSLGQIAYDAISTTANQLPSWTIGGLAGGAAGAISLGLSAGGNVYEEAIRSGATVGQARAFAAVTAASEAGLEKILGGIQNFGGLMSNHAMQRAIQSISDVGARISIQFGGEMLSEGVEEYLQDILEPVFRNIIFDENNQVKLFTKEALYSGMLGSLTAGMMNTVSGGIQYRNDVVTGKAIQKSGKVSDLVEQGKKYSMDSLAYLMANKVNENSTPSEIGRLYREMGAFMSEQNKADIERELVETHHMTPDTAKVLASSVENIMNGEKLSERETRLLDMNRSVASAVVGTMIDQNSTVYQRRMAMNEAYSEVEKANGNDVAFTKPDEYTKIDRENTFATDENGKLMFNTDEGLMSLRNANLNDAETAVAKLISDTSMDIETANDVWKATETARTKNDASTAIRYAASVQNAYDMGRKNIDYRLGTEGDIFSSYASDSLRSKLYAKGQTDAAASTMLDADKRKMRQITKNKKGNVFINADYKNLSDTQKSGVSFARVLSKAFGIDFAFFSSFEEGGRRVYKNSNGDIVSAPNGIYDRDTGTIYLDLNAGDNGEGLVLYTMSHELTHFIQQWSNTKYKTLSDFLMQEYAAKGKDVNTLVKAQQEKAARNGKKYSYDAAFDEVIADSMQSMLSDTNAIEKLMKLKAKDESLANRLVNQIKRFADKVRAAYAELDPDTEEGRAVKGMTDKLDEISTLWTDALKDAAENFNAADVQKNTAQEGGVQYDSRNGYSNYDYTKPITVDDIFVLRAIGRKSVNDFTTDDIQKAQKWAYKFYQELGTKSPFFRAWFGDWRAHQTREKVQIVSIPAYIATNEARKTQRGNTVNTDTGWDIRISRDGETNTISHSGNERLSEYGLSGIRSLVENAILFNTEVHEQHSKNAKNDLIAFDHKLYSLGKDTDGNVAVYRITVEEYFQSKSQPNEKKFHNLKYIEKVAEISADALPGETRSGGSTVRSSTTIYSISDLYSLVKKYDKEFTPAHAVDIAMINKDGTPKVMYHGSQAQFTAFDKRKAKGSGLYGRGFYFTDSKNHAGTYGNLYAVYLNIRNPLRYGEGNVSRDQVKKFLDAVSENEDYSIENYGTYDTESIVRSLFGGKSTIDAFKVIQDINATAIGDFVDAVLLFNQVNGTDYDGIMTPTETVAFYSTQIKSATDNIGTFDGSNPDIRYSDRTGDANRINREILANALDSAAQTEREKERLQEYKGIIAEVSRKEARIGEIREELRKLRSGKGRRDMETIRRLTDEMRTLEANVSVADSKLLRLQAAKPLQNILNRNKAEFDRLLSEQTRQAAKNQRLADERAYGKDIAELKRHNKEVAQRKSIRKQETVLRNDIKKILSSLDKRMLRPTEGKYVPKAMKGVVAEILADIDRTSANGDTAPNKLLAALSTQYKAMADTNKDSSYAFDSAVSEMLETVAAYNKPLRDMNVAELKNTKDALTALDHAIKNAVKLESFKILGITEDMNVFQFSKKLIQETRSLPASQRGIAYKFFLTQLRPETVFRWFGGYSKNSAWTAIYNAFDSAQKKGMFIQKDLNSCFEQVVISKEARTLFDLNNMVDVGLRSESGEPVYITRGMMLSLYMHLLNEQNAKHVMEGGLTVPNMKDYYKGKLDDAYGVNQIHVFGISQGIAALREEYNRIEQMISNGDENTDIMELESRLNDIENQIEQMQKDGNVYIDNILSEINGMLTDYERSVISATQELYRKSQKYLNEATMQMYGFEKAKVENYFPIITDKAFLGTQFDSISANFNLENAGFMKERTNGANPILLSDIMDVNAKQIRKSAQYASMTPVLKDFNKVFGKTETGYRDSVQKALEQKFNVQGKQYIENLIADLNGSSIVRKEISGLDHYLSIVRGNMAQATLSLNLRVALSQAASMPTAAAELGWEAVGYAISKSFTKSDLDLIAKYSPLLWYRMQGNSTIELGDLKQNRTAYGRIKNSKAYNYAMGWIGSVDAWTVQRLWFGAEYWVEHNTKLEKGSDAFYNAVAEKFDATVERTQPNYSTLQRSDILRSKDPFVRILTMFTTQRNQNFNILADAWLDLYYTRQQKIDGDRNITQDDVNSAKKKFASAVSSQVVSAGTYVLMRYLVDAVMHNMNAYRDDDDEITFGSTAQEILHQLGASIAGMSIFGSEIYDFVYKRLADKTYYSPSLSGISSISDLIKSAWNVWSKPTSTNLYKLAKDFSTVLGIPMNNAVKIVRGFSQHIQDFRNHEFFSFEAGVERTTGQQKNRWLEAALDGDTEKVNRVYSELMKYRMSLGDTETEAKKQTDTNIKNAVKDALQIGDIGTDEAEDVLVKNNILSASEAKQKVDWWVFSDDHDDWYDDLFYKYAQYAEPVGITAEMFYEAHEATKSMTADKDKNGNTINGSRKKKVLDYINRLKISKTQKDALYLALGEKESTIDEAPWH